MSIKYSLKDLERDFGKLTFAKLLKAHRLGEEMSQVEFAKKLKISKQSLCDLESGRVIPSISRAAKIGKQAGLMPAQFVELALQDQIDREKLKLTVRIENIVKAS